MRKMPAFHHLDLWVANFSSSRPAWNWILTEIGWRTFQTWPNGQSWQAPDGSYLGIEQSPDLSETHHDRTRPGMNHLAITSTRRVLDEIVNRAPQNGWSLLFPEQHPFAGGEQHYAAFLASDDGFELEIVATDQ